MHRAPSSKTASSSLRSNSNATLVSREVLVRFAVPSSVAVQAGQIVSISLDAKRIVRTTVTRVAPRVDQAQMLLVETAPVAATPAPLVGNTCRVRLEADGGNDLASSDDVASGKTNHQPRKEPKP